jgi:polyisoprenoid-binding protein YceI
MTTTTSTPLKVGRYVVDVAHTEVGFVARHLVGTKVRGRFTEFSGAFTVAENPEESTLEAEVKTASIIRTRPCATTTCAQTIFSMPRRTLR